MRKVLLGLAVTAAAIATPALANEGRIEARGGIVFDGSNSEDVYGIAAGYDFDLGSSAFAGVEVSGDKIGAPGTKVAFGATGRLGAKVGGNTKVYVDGGYTTETCSGCVDAVHAGAGVELGFSSNLYGKLGYRHFFVGSGFSDYDAVVVGLGVRF